MLRAILLDFNGVLVDDEPIHRQVFDQVLAEEGIAPPEGGWRLEGEERAALARALESAGEEAPLPRLMRLVARKATYFRRAIRERGYPLTPGTTELVEQATAAGMMLGVVTEASQEEVARALGAAGLADRFKVVFTAEEVPAAGGALSPEVFREALIALNSRPPLPERLLHPHEVLAVADRAAVIEAARDAGLVTVGVAWRQAPAELAAADRVVASLSRLTLNCILALVVQESSR